MQDDTVIFHEKNKVLEPTLSTEKITFKVLLMMTTKNVTFFIFGSSKKGANSIKRLLPQPSRTSTQMQDLPLPKSASGPEYILKHIISPWSTGVSSLTSIFATYA